MKNLITAAALIAITAGTASAAVSSNLANSVVAEAAQYGYVLDTASLTTSEVSQLHLALTSSDSNSDKVRAIRSVIN